MWQSCDYYRIAPFCSYMICWAISNSVGQPCANCRIAFCSRHAATLYIDLRAPKCPPALMPHALGEPGALLFTLAPRDAKGRSAWNRIVFGRVHTHQQKHIAITHHPTLIVAASSHHMCLSRGPKARGGSGGSRTKKSTPLGKGGGGRTRSGLVADRYLKRLAADPSTRPRRPREDVPMINAGSVCVCVPDCNTSLRLGRRTWSARREVANTSALASYVREGNPQPQFMAFDV